MAKPVDAQAVTVNCPVCRYDLAADKKISQGDILQFKRPYLTDCSKHLTMWDAADAKDRAREQKRGR